MCSKALSALRISTRSRPPGQGQTLDPPRAASMTFPESEKTAMAVMAATVASPTCRPRCTPSARAESRSCGSRGRRSAMRSTTTSWLGVEAFFAGAAGRHQAAVVHGEGEHFSAGLDLSELRRATPPRASRTRGCGIARSSRSSSARCRWSRCCTARWSAAGWSSPRRAHVRVAERSRLLRAARRQPRHLRRRRRLGAAPAADRHRRA